MKFTALISCFNEEKTIENILRALIASPFIEKIVVVDAASTDQTPKIVKRFQGEKLEPVFLTQKLGKGEAVKIGLKKVKTKEVFLCDADIRGLKEFHLENFVKHYQKQSPQMVVGLREKRLSKITHFLRKNFLPLIAGERILPTYVLKEVTKNPLSSNWGLEVVLNYYCRKKKIKVTKLLLKGVNDLPKWKKGHGLKAHLKEASDVVLRHLLIYVFYFPYEILSSHLYLKKSTKRDFQIKKMKIGSKVMNFAQTGQGEPLLLIHGWANNWEGWIPLAVVLRKRYKLYLIDLLGFGDSSPLKNYTIKAQAKYVSLFLKKIKIAPKAIVGLSMGSLVAAACGKNFPKATGAIILLGAPFKTENHFLAAKALEKGLAMVKGKKRAEMLVKKIVETRVTAYLLAKYINMHKFNKFLVDTYGMIGKKKMRKEAFVQMGLSAAKLNLEDVLDKCRMPVFLIYGAQDKVISLKEAKKLLKDKNGKFTFASIPSAGHVVNLEKPKKVARLIEDFLKKV